VICAGCAGVESPFACRDCGSEEHPYGGIRCARCILAERLGQLLTDPATGQVHARLQPVFDELVGSERPQTGIWWLRKKPGVGPRLLAQIARGEIEVSHATFRALPSDRAHDYLRNLLAALSVLEPLDPRIERMQPWLEDFLTSVPAAHVDILRRYTHWHVLRDMRRAAAQGRLTQSIADAKRRCIRVAAEFLAYLDHRDLTIETATQAALEDFQDHVGRQLRHEHSFVTWLRNSRINTGLQIPYVPRAQPESQRRRRAPLDHRGTARERHHDPPLHPHRRTVHAPVRPAPLTTRRDAGRPDQRDRRPSPRRLPQHPDPDAPPSTTFSATTSTTEARASMPHAAPSGCSPAATPGRHLATENIRAQLVEIGINPYQRRKAALLQLASDIPAPVLAELIGITNDNAADWARLAARDWTGYIADRAR